MSRSEDSADHSRARTQPLRLKQVRAAIRAASRAEG